MFGETSSPSSLWDTERLRPPFMFFRLDEEKFFRRPVLDCVRPGEPDAGVCPMSLSLVKVWVRIGVGGDKISAGLGPGNGDDAWRADCGTGGRIISPLKGCRCCGSPAVLGWTATFSIGIRKGGIDGGCELKVQRVLLL